MARITLQGINKIYPNGTHAVHNVDLDIADGEFMIMVGPSGCAKSTILRMIAGLETPSSGSIEIGGRVVNDVAPKDRDIAMVFQSYALYPHMTVRENMAFGLRLRKMSEQEIAQRVSEAANILGLEQLLDRLPKQMSGGQRQRVAMGRAIVREPQAFLMDEPLSNLDAKLRVQMRTEIAKLHQRLQTTTVYVTHDQVEAMTLGQRICILRKGVIQQVDTPHAVYHFPANVFVGGFIGSPGMNFMMGTLHAHDGIASVSIGSTTFPLPQDVTDRLIRPISHNGTQVIVGIRPEHLHEAPPSSGTPMLQARVDLIETLGAEAFAYLHLPVPTPDLSSLSDTQGQGSAQSCVARLGVDHVARQGGEILLSPDMSHIHLFDPDTHETLLSSEPAPASTRIYVPTNDASPYEMASVPTPAAMPIPVAPTPAPAASPVPLTADRNPHRVGIATAAARAALGDIDPALLHRRGRTAPTPLRVETPPPAPVNLPVDHVMPGHVTAEHATASQPPHTAVSVPLLSGTRPKLFQSNKLFGERADAQNTR